jgi:capsid protein
LAVLSAAEAAADFAGILYTDAPAGGESDEVDPMDNIELRRNMLVTMPQGWKMAQMDPKQPCSSYAEFHSKILNEIARCLSMPYNIAAGNSSGYNYASGRLDHQTYFKSLRVERANIDINVLNPIFRRWLREYVLVTGIKVKNAEHSWFWDGFEHVDPGKEANAIDVKLANGTTTYAIEYAKQGLDWESAFNQLAKEKKKMAELGLTPADLKASRNINNPEVDDE